MIFKQRAALRTRYERMQAQLAQKVTAPGVDPDFEARLRKTEKANEPTSESLQRAKEVEKLFESPSQ